MIHILWAMGNRREDKKQTIGKEAIEKPLAHHQLPVVRYSWIEFAARLPSPIASITVAPPLTISPPARTPFLLVIPVFGSDRMFPALFVFMSAVVSGIRG